MFYCILLDSGKYNHYLLLSVTVYCNRLMNLGISKQQHLYLRTKQFNLKIST